MLQGPGLITRGLGTTNVVSRGYGFFGQVVQAVVDAGRRIVRGGRSARKKLDELWTRIFVKARLVSRGEYSGTTTKAEALNHGFPFVEGTTYVEVDPNKQIHVRVRQLDTQEESDNKKIFVTGKRIY